jgi:hypothetical protein
VDVNWRRRIQNNWSLTAALTFSRTYGNYGGLTSSDENGRNSPGVNRYYDGVFMNFTQQGCPSLSTPTCVDQGLVTYGILPTDRPVVAKLTGTYITPWGTSVGVSFWAGNGVTNSSTISYKGVPVFVYGRNDIGRSPMLNYTDINFQHFFRLPHRMKATLQLDIKNVFDQDTGTTKNTTQYLGGTLVLTGDALSPGPFFAGFDTKAEFAKIAAAASATSVNGIANPTLGMFNNFYSPRRATLYIKFQF